MFYQLPMESVSHWYHFWIGWIQEEYDQLPMESARPWCKFWINVIAAVSVAILWDELVLSLLGKPVVISGFNFITLVILMGTLHEIRYAVSVIDIHWSHHHEDIAEITCELRGIKNELTWI